MLHKDDAAVKYRSVGVAQFEWRSLERQSSLEERILYDDALRAADLDGAALQRSRPLVCFSSTLKRSKNGKCLQHRGPACFTSPVDTSGHSQDSHGDFICFGSPLQDRGVTPELPLQPDTLEKKKEKEKLIQLNCPRKASVTFRVVSFRTTCYASPAV